MLNCAVVVDRASVEHRLGEALGVGGRVPLDLGRLAKLLRAYGLEPVELAAAVPRAAIVDGPDCNPVLARRDRESADQWWSKESRSLAPHVRCKPLWGASNGRGEVAVDLAVVAGALDAAMRSEERGIDLVVVVSHDADFHHLHRYCQSVPLVVAGSFTQGERRLCREGKVPRLDIPKLDFCTLSAQSRALESPGLTLHDVRQDDLTGNPGLLREGDKVLIARTNSNTPVIRSGPLTRRVAGMPALRKALSLATTIAVVDPYGLFNSAVRSIGTGGLPNAQSVQQLLASLWWSGPTAVLATIPDLRRHTTEQLDSDLQSAWKSRDQQLDALAATFDDDGDPLTVATRSPLQPGRARLPGTSGIDPDPDRTLVNRALKRLATGLLADLWLAATLPASPDVPTPQVVLLSDDFELAATLELLPHCRIHALEDVVRIGLHAHRGHLELPQGANSAEGQLVVLKDNLVAQLTGADLAQYGGRHRKLLASALSDENSVIRTGGRDPETGGRVLHIRVDVEEDGDAIPDRRNLTALLYGTKTQLEHSRPSTSVESQGEHDDLLITFDRDSVCAHPVIVYGQKPEGGTSREAIVVDQQGSWITVDLDGDGVADSRVPLGHAALDFDPDRRIVVHQDPGGNLQVIDPASALEDELQPEVVQITSRVVFRNQDCWSAMPVGPADGVALPLVRTSSKHALEGSEGDRLLALCRDGSDGRYYVAMSTPLQHLQRLPGPTNSPIEQEGADA